MCMASYGYYAKSGTADLAPNYFRRIRATDYCTFVSLAGSHRALRSVIRPPTAETAGATGAASLFCEFDPAILGSALRRIVGFHGFAGAESFGREAGGVDLKLADEYLFDGLGAALGEIEIGGGLPRGVRVAFDFQFQAGIGLQAEGDGAEDRGGFRLDAVAVGIEQDSVRDKLPGGGDGLAEIGRHFGDTDGAVVHFSAAEEVVHNHGMIDGGDLHLVGVDHLLSVQIEPDAPVLDRKVLFNQCLVIDRELLVDQGFLQA